MFECGQADLDLRSLVTQSYSWHARLLPQHRWWMSAFQRWPVHPL